MIGYLLDRDVLGEVEDPDGHKNVRAWISSIPDCDLFISAITVMEARKGFGRLRTRARTPSARAEVEIFEASFDTLLEAFDSQILCVDRAIADSWAEMLAQREANVMDAGVAATASVHGLVVATRNLRDLRGRGVDLVDPFKKDPRIEAPSKS